MAQDAHTQFVDGLRVTADHLQHLQDALRDSVNDLRRAVGTGRIAWGLRVQVSATVGVGAGVAFAPGGERLALDSPISLPAPASGAGPWRVVLRASNSDSVPLQVDGVPTLIYETTAATVEADDGSDLGPDALAIASLAGAIGSVAATQDAALFVAAGSHRHSGAHVQDAQGRWHFDGAPIDLGALPPGPAGPQGPAGAAGAAGAAGPIGPAGPAGAIGTAGPAGAAGAAGVAGPQGAPGAQGPAGAQGTQGPAGPQGPAGAAAAKGDPGPQGQPGAAGARGDPGAQGAPGPAGGAGPAGPAGANGAAGAPGAAGAVGAAGAKGDAGPQGAQGAAGQQGPQGPQGAVGPQGPQGPAGSADFKNGFVAKVSWTHGGSMTVAQFTTLSFELSTALHAAVRELRPRVVQVWLQTAGGSAQTPAAATTQPTPLLTVHGDVTFPSPQVITFTVTDDPATLKRGITQPALALIRLHCWSIWDASQQIYSAAPDVLIKLATPHLPGGIFESWVTITP